MEDEKEVTIEDLYPESVTVELAKGKKAIIGLFTFDTLRWTREKYGSLEKFQNDVLAKLAVNTQDAVFGLLDIIFEMLENKDDFKNQREFERCITVGKSGELGKAIGMQITKSMPKPEPQKAGSKKAAKKRGGTR